MADESQEPKNSENQVKPQINEHQLNLLMEQLRGEQNILGALLGGGLAALVGASIWAIITAVTHYQIGWMAIGVGFLVGYTVKYFGKGIDKIYGVIGALFALLGCLSGNFFAIVIAVSNQELISILDILANTDMDLFITVMIDSFHPMDVLFYGFAIYQGYKVAFRQLTEQQLAQIPN